MKKLSVATVLFLLTSPLLSQGLKLFPKGEKPNGFVFFSIVIGAILLALAVHELGHLITGLAQGFRFQLFVVGPLGIKREEGKIKVYLNKNFGMMGGVAVTVPVVQSIDNRKKFARLILAGPLTSLVFGIVCIALASFTNGLLIWFLFIAGGSSVGLFGATTIPRKSGIYFTDRARYQRLKSKGQAGDSEQALLEIIAQSMGDNSHKNIPVERAVVLQQDDEPFMKFWGYYYEHLYYKENEIADKADETLNTLIANKMLISKEIWKMLKVES